MAAGADFGARVRGSGIRYVRLLTDADVATGVEAWTAAGIIGAFAVDGGTYAFASCGTAALRSALDRRDLDAFRATWTAAYPPAARILGSVRSFDELIINEVIRVDCARWFQGRLALLGDAAHAMAPNLGQGANSALVDGAVLLDELRRAPDLATGLEAYQRRRRPAVRRVALTAAHLGRLAEVTNPLMRAARDRLLLPIASRLSRPGAIAQMMQEPSDVLRAIGSA